MLPAVTVRLLHSLFWINYCLLLRVAASGMVTTFEQPNQTEETSTQERLDFFTNYAI
jgi:hypothetical protein